MKSIINKKLEPTMCGMMTLVDTTEEEQEIIKKSITTIMLKNNLIHKEFNMIIHENKTFENDKIIISCSSEHCVNKKYCKFEAINYKLKGSENEFMCPDTLEKCWLNIKVKEQ